MDLSARMCPESMINNLDRIPTAMADQFVKEDDKVDDESGSSSREAELFCRRCWRDERHFHKFRAQSPVAYTFWCIATLGFVYFLGPYLCRCCGQSRFWRFDLLDAQQSRQLGVSNGWKTKTPNHYVPFRNRISLFGLVRKSFRFLARLIPRRRNHRRRRRR